MTIIAVLIALLLALAMVCSFLKETAEVRAKRDVEIAKHAAELREATTREQLLRAEAISRHPASFTGPRPLREG